MNTERTMMNTPPNSVDPVVTRRNRIERLNIIASRTGYGLYTVSFVSFFVGLWTSLTGPMHFLSGATLIVGSIILAPSIVIHYGIRAARREDAAASPTASPTK